MLISRASREPILKKKSVLIHQPCGTFHGGIMINVLCADKASNVLINVHEISFSSSYTGATTECIILELFQLKLYYIS